MKLERFLSLANRFGQWKLKGFFIIILGYLQCCGCEYESGSNLLDQEIRIGFISRFITRIQIQERIKQ
jgi:hypothetical protein